MIDRFEEACRWAAARNTRLCCFAVVRREFEGRYVRAEYASIGQARDAALRGGLSRTGRKPKLYGITPEGWAVEIEEIDPAAGGSISGVGG